MAVVVKPLTQGFGAAIEAFDARDGRDLADIAALRAAFDRHHLLVLRDCGQLSPERHAEIVAWFGDIGPQASAAGEASSKMDNQHSSGRAILPFHCDITFFQFPIEGISLHPLILPDAPTTTTFISNAVAWDALDAPLKAQLRGLRGRHFYADDGKIDPRQPIFEHWHPVCLPHHRSGRELLFVTEHHVDRIEGHDDVAGAALLARLFGVLYAPERRYEHVWRPGDFVVWDNYAIQHARTREARPEDGARVLQRVAFGAHGFAEQYAAFLADGGVLAAA